MFKKIAVLPGDGIGPEIMTAAKGVLQAIEYRYGHRFEWTEGLIGSIAIDKTGSALPPQTVELCKSSDAVLLGAIGDPKYDNNPDAPIRPEQGLLELRKTLGLYANIRPIRIFDKLKHLSPLKVDRLNNVDFVIYRELTGGIYFGEKCSDSGFSSDLCIYHNYEIDRMSYLAFEEARRRKGKLCLVDKANVLESSRLWRRRVGLLALKYPDVELSYLFIDNAAMQMILNPGQFDVVLTSNMFGDILSDEASVLNGSLGLLPSASKGEEYKLYEPVHGSYPQAAGKDIANPLAMILSVEMMLRDWGLVEEADSIIQSVDSCITQNQLTEDLNTISPISCSELGHLVAEKILAFKKEVI